MTKRSIFFTATHRSGSTLLMEMIRKVNRIGRPGELFYPQNIADIQRRQGWQPDLGVQSWLPAVVEEGSSPNGFFSVKVFADNFRWLAEQVSGKSWPDAKSSLPGFFAGNFPGARFVAIRRRDKLKQGISLHKALLTGVWHSNQVEKVKARKAYYQRDLIQWAKSEIREQEEELESIYDLLGVTPQVFYYEDMLQDIPGTLASVFALAGEPLPVTQPPQVDLKRMSNPQNKAWLERFEKEEEVARGPGQAILANSEAPVFEIHIDKPDETLLPGTKLETGFSIKNLRAEPIVFIGHLSGNGSIRLRVHATRSDGKASGWYRLPVPHRLEPGETAQVDFNYETPSENGTYTLDIRADQMGLGPLKIIGTPEVTIEISNHLEAPIRKLFGEFSFTADNWYYSSWFGYFYAHCWPMILSLSHGWLKVEEESSENLKVFDFQMGFWSTSADMYPEIRYDDGRIFRYIRTDGEIRIFEDDCGKVFKLSLSKNQDED